MAMVWIWTNEASLDCVVGRHWDLNIDKNKTDNDEEVTKPIQKQQSLAIARELLASSTWSVLHTGPNLSNRLGYCCNHCDLLQWIL